MVERRTQQKVRQNARVWYSGMRGYSEQCQTHNGCPQFHLLLLKIKGMMAAARMADASKRTQSNSELDPSTREQSFILQGWH